MPQWIPDDKKVDGREPIGRRRFAQPTLAGAKDQTPIPDRLDYRDFEDSRGEVSLDRLGKTGPEKQVTAYLTERAATAALGRNRRFVGWRYIPAKFLAENKKVAMNLVPSPILDGGEQAELSGESTGDSTAQREPDPLKENVYHAHIECVGTIEKPAPNPYFLALHLKELFERNGQDHLPASNTPHIEHDELAVEQAASAEEDSVAAPELESLPVPAQRHQPMRILKWIRTLFKIGEA